MIETEAGYVRHVQGEREAKDDFFRRSPHSPLPHGDRARFAGLTYYPVDVATRIRGLRLEPAVGRGPGRFEIATSDGRSRPAVRLGVLRFQIRGQDRELAAYDLGGSPGSLFVPFLDATSGPETYGAGRYLDLEPEPDGTYTLDFNLAYHPWCAYATNYSCPLTPAENRLPDRIEAGERLPTASAR